MRNMENLNNMKKTVLKLEKEINAISNNLSKSKNKEYTAMKNIINNINYLLTKDSPKNSKYTNENEINYNRAGNKNITEKHEIKNNNQNIRTINTKIDSIIIPVKQNTNKNKKELH